MWYHITNYLGKIKVLEPRVPRFANEDAEGDIPRICVSGSIFHCLRAIDGYKYLSSVAIGNKFTENPSVYFTEEIPFLPPNCNDFRYNGERWFIKPTKFFYLGRVDIGYLFKYNTIVPTESAEIILPKKEKIIYDAPKEVFLQKVLYNGK